MRFFKALLSLLSVIATLSCAPTEEISFNVTPSRYVFDLYTSTSPYQRIVTVTNDGTDDLILTEFRGVYLNRESFRLDYALSSDLEDTDFREGLNVSGNHFPEEIRLAAQDTLQLRLTYSLGERGPGGQIMIRTNTSPSDIVIPITSEALVGDLRADRSVVNFRSVSVGESSTSEITITNQGFASAFINQIFLNTTREYTLSLDGVDVIGSAAEIPILMDPDGDGEPGLSPMSSVTFNVTYTPDSENAIRGEVTFALIGAIQDSVTVTLSPGVDDPCVNLQLPNSASNESSVLRFDSTAIDSTAQSEVIIESCGSQPLEMISVTYEGAPEFTLGADVASINREGRLAPQSSRSFTVQFTPLEVGVYQGTLVITTNDPDYPELRINIVGRGKVNICPEAVVTTSMLNVLPLEIITLDGSRSVDVDGPNNKPVAYEWIVVDQPEGSTARPVERFLNPLRPGDGGELDDPSTPSAQFFVDLAGEYVFHLVITDSAGFIAPSEMCPQSDAVMLVSALPDEDIRVELTWTTPEDPDETDTERTDLDLHFRHPNGQRWSQSPYDCYYANPNPDWGPAGDVGNPSLNIDDPNGVEPENIKLNDPEYTDQTTTPGPYLVGVHYYTGLFSSDYGPSEAMIHIYLGGALAGTYTRVLNATGNFWEVAGVIWTSAEQRVQEINRFYSTPPW